jgi:putative transposase
MARPPRGTVEAGMYHVFTRTPGRVPFFMDDVDRTDFCNRLARTIAKLDWRCEAFALLTTHYHVLIDVPTNALQPGMKWLNGTYAQRFNKQHGRWGHLCGSRYSLVPVESERQLRAVARYIYRNAVEADLCELPQDWPWSSYAGTAGYAKPFPFVEDVAVRAVFGYGSEGTDFLRAYVEEAVTEPLRGTVPV